MLWINTTKSRKEWSTRYKTIPCQSWTCKYSDNWGSRNIVTLWPYTLKENSFYPKQAVFQYSNPHSSLLVALLSWNLDNLLFLIHPTIYLDKVHGFWNWMRYNHSACGRHSMSRDSLFHQFHAIVEHHGGTGLNHVVDCKSMA